MREAIKATSTLAVLPPVWPARLVVSSIPGVTIELGAFEPEVLEALLDSLRQHYAERRASYLARQKPDWTMGGVLR